MFSIGHLRPDIIKKGAEKFHGGGGDYPGVEMMRVFIKKGANCALFFIDCQSCSMSILLQLLDQLLHQ